MSDQQQQTVANWLGAARRVLFITGAGVSAESGIPTFRGSTAAFANGLTEDGIRFEDALSGPFFARNPQRAWKYFFNIEKTIRGKLPNAAHHAIAALQQSKRQVIVATQNIDGLHQAAGSADVIELHGNLFRIVCTECDYRSHSPTFEKLPALPRCPQCRAVLRPDIVLYDEMLPEPALESFALEQEKGFDLVVSVGTTSIFHYVTEPILIAARRGIPTVEINPEETSLSGTVDVRLPSRAGPALQDLVQRIC